MEQSKAQEYVELLKDAAKAAGHRIVEWATDGNGVEVAIIVRSDGDGFSKRPWQPLHENQMTDADGDALRLAVKSQFHVGINPGNKVFCSPTYGDKPTVFESCERDGVQDPYAATRLAIVRAAAEIGRSIA